MDQGSVSLDSEAPPALPLDQASALAGELFNVTGRLTPLESERDQNFLVRTDALSFVLKISNSADTPGSVDFQTQILLHVARTDPELRVPRIVRTVDGATHGTVVDTRGRSSIVRLLTYLPGAMRQPDELSAETRADYGSSLARLGIALRGFFHPAAGRDLLFDLKHASHAMPMVEAITEPKHRAMATQVLETFAREALPRFPMLRAQVVHNDLTLENVLFDDSGRVSGIVDFGDAVHTALVCDLSSALASVLLQSEDPAKAAVQFLDGYRREAPLEEAELEMLPQLLATRLAMSVAWAAWRVQRFPDTAEYVNGMVDGAWPLLTWLTDGGQAEMMRSVVGSQMHVHQPLEKLAVRRRVFGSALENLTYTRPFAPVRAAGVWMYDGAGRRYLDMYNNVPHVGHCHPRVVAAVIQQTRALNTNTRYLHETPIQLAERLTGTTSGLDVCILLNSGTEANDLAWQLAKAYSGHTGALVTADAYHGFTESMIEISPAERAGVMLPSHVERFAPPDGYRGPYRRDEPSWVHSYLVNVDTAIANLRRRGFGLAAGFIDSVFTSDGIFSPPSGYMRGLARAVHDAGGLVVADEVQGGFGRLGEMWSFQTADLDPDIVVLGKPMGNGYPIGAILTRAEIVDQFAKTRRFFSTFGGNPVACAASMAVLDVLETDDLLGNAGTVGAHMMNRLVHLAEEHEAIGDVRGQGLLFGVDLVIDRASRVPATGLAGTVLDRLRENGILVGLTGPAGNVLKIRPPMVAGIEHADVLADALGDALKQELTASYF